VSSTYQVLNEILISKAALNNNYHYFADRHPESSVAPVIKANAYGHGLIPIASYIQDHISNVPFVCVDSLYEAYELSKNNLNIDCLILGYTNPKNYQIKKSLPYIFGVSDLLSLKSLGEHQPTARIHLEFDTGLSRLGFTITDIPQVLDYLSRYPKLKVEGIYSHFAAADDLTESTYTKNQVIKFKEIIGEFNRSGLTFKYRHISATAGSEVIYDTDFNLIRLGLGFYGYSPFGPRTTEGMRQRKHLQPALELKTHIAHLQPIQAGVSVGYSRTYISKQQENIGTLPLGYYEGIDRSLSNQGAMTIGKIVCPVVGNISMNMTTIKIPRNYNPKLDDPVTVISSNPSAINSVYSLAKITHTIPYTVLTRLNNSIRRSLI
jgi:alanine racemase